MPQISLLKRITGSWEQHREHLRQDLQKIQTAINAIPETPTVIPVRSSSIISGPTPSINTDELDFFAIVKLTEDIKSFTMNLQGSPTNGQELTIRILDDGTPRSITWGSSFASAEGILPTTTHASEYLYIHLVWNAITSTWDCIATGDGTSTSIDASQIVSGTIATARLGSGSATSSTLLSGDQTYKQVADAQVASAAAIGWTKISKTGSSLADLTTRSATDLATGTLSDGRLSANIPLLNAGNTFSHAGNNFTDVTSPKFYFNSGIALNSVDLGSVVNTTITPLSIDSLVEIDALIMVLTQGTGGFHVTSQVILRGTDQGTIIVSDPGTILSTTKGTASKVNIYWDAGNARYEIENKSTITLRIGVIYFMLRN